MAVFIINAVHTPCSAIGVGATKFIMWRKKHSIPFQAITVESVRGATQVSSSAAGLNSCLTPSPRG